MQGRRSGGKSKKGQQNRHKGPRKVKSQKSSS
jgi:hypothetical protein